MTPPKVNVSDVFTVPGATWLYFKWLGMQYRTNADATLIEGLDCQTWNRTCSRRLVTLALEALDKNSR